MVIDEFPIVLTPESIDVIKRDLAKSLSHVKSSHRIEAFARACGFSTYAALNAAVKEKGAIETKINWQRFYDYLSSKGFKVTAAPLLNTAASAALHEVLEEYQNLQMFGFGYSDKPMLEERKREFASDRDYLRTSPKHFLRGYVLMSRIDKVKNFNLNYGSYSLKHLAEKYPCTYPDGEKLGPEYTTNGALIAAAIYAGFKCKQYPGNLNADFNISKRSLREIEDMLRETHGNHPYT